jgi:hypothetical protein
LTPGAVMDAKRTNERERRMRARNRVLAAALFALALLFYAISFIRTGGG